MHTFLLWSTNTSIDCCFLTDLIVNTILTCNTWIMNAQVITAASVTLMPVAAPKPVFVKHIGKALL